MSKRKFAFPEIVPWPEPVDGAVLADDILSTLRRFLVLPDGAAEAITLWTFFTHTFDAWECSPRLVFTSREPECGKTTSLSILARLVPTPLPTVSITPAALFRIIEKHQPSLLIDEADTFIEGNEELRGVLNSGHTRDTAFVWRCHPETLEPEGFSTWSPMAIAKIGGLPPTLWSRSIIIRMRRKTPSELVERFLPSHRVEVELLARRAARWAEDNLPRLRGTNPTMPAGLGSRAADNWRPLVAIADAIGSHWPTIARDTAMKLGANWERAVGLDAVLRLVVERYASTRKPIPEALVRDQLRSSIGLVECGKVISELLARKKLASTGVPPVRMLKPVEGVTI